MEDPEEFGIYSWKSDEDTYKKSEKKKKEKEVISSFNKIKYLKHSKN